MSTRLAKTTAFCQRFGLRAPILLAPMAGIPAPALSAAVIDAGGLGACGVLLMSPDDIAKWCATVRAESDGPIHLNLWIPDPPPRRDAEHETRVRGFLAGFGPEVAASAADVPARDFNAHCEAMLQAKPALI